MTQYKYTHDKPLILPELGRVQPDQIFSIDNPEMEPIFTKSGLFEPIKSVKTKPEPKPKPEESE